MRLALAAFAACFLAAVIGLPVIEDEAYYWTWSRAPSLTYFDHPPGVAWVLAASTRLLGDGVLGLRAASLLAVALVLFATHRSAEALSPGTGPRALAVLLGAPMFAVGYVPGTHDVLLGALCALAGHAIVRERSGALAAFLLSSGILLKHASAVLGLGVLLGVASLPEGRARLARPWPWLGLALGLACAAPWIAADLGGGGSIAFQATHVFDYAPARGLLAIPLVCGSMLLTLGPVGGALVWIAGLGARTVEARALWGGALALLVACVIAVWAGSGEANWPMPALALAAPLLGARRVPRALTLVSGAACLALLLHAAQPWIPFPARKDPTLRGAGYERLAAEVARVSREHGATLLVTRRYQHASLLRYHLRDALPMLELGNKRRKSQYDVWPRPPLCGTVVWASPERAPPELAGLEPLGDAVAVPRGEGLEPWFIAVLRAPPCAG